MTKSKAYIKYTEYYLPAKVVGNSTIAKYSDTLTASKIEEKTGICVRHVAGPDEYSSDLASKACEKLFKK